MIALSAIDEASPPSVKSSEAVVVVKMDDASELKLRFDELKLSAYGL